MRRAGWFLTAWSVFAAASVSASAQDWATIFPDRNHDFGTVARGSKVRHSFRVVNTTRNQEIHIADTRTKCGCTEVRIGARAIPAGTETVVEAVLDTTKFVGYKPSGLTLVIDRPVFMEVDLNFSCFIRGDVTLNPGFVDFGVTGRAAARPVPLTLTYAGGMPDWEVTKMQTISPHVTAQLRELSRNGGTVQYELTATLKPTVPSGYFKDEITLRTNDPSTPTIPISVVANVQAGVTASPSVINLGRIKTGQAVKKNVLVRAAQPFKITQTSAAKGDVSAAAPPAEAAKPLHTLAIEVKTPDQPGPYNAVLEIATDVKDEPPAKVTIFATVVP